MAGGIPWLKIHEYVLKLSSSDTLEELLQTAVASIDLLFPESTVCSVASLQEPVAILAYRGCRDSPVRSYLSHYLERAPFDWQEIGTTRHNVDNRTFQGTEFVEDWARPAGVLYIADTFNPRAHVALGVCYPWRGREFGHEIETLALVNRHLDRLYCAFRKIESLIGGRIVPDEDNFALYADRYKLTSREIQILRLMVDSYRVPQIAIILLLSRRTVEGHIANMYVKTGTKKREELIQAAGRALGIFGTVSKERVQKAWS